MERVKQEEKGEKKEESLDNLYFMVARMYKERFPCHDLERYVPRHQGDDVVTSMHNKINGRYSAGYKSAEENVSLDKVI